MAQCAGAVNRVWREKLSDRPLTYSEVWDQYASGKLSTVTLRQLLMRDEVFRRWCEKRAEAERKARDIKAQQMISDEDMA